MVMDLEQIDGVGTKLSKKILDSVGGKENLSQIVENRDLEQLSRIEGISQRKAIQIMNSLLGNPQEKFLKSERAHVLYEEIISKILNFSNTSYSRNRVQLLSPTTDVDTINSHLDFVMDAKDKISHLPIDDLKVLMKNLGEPEEVRGSYDPSKVIVVESQEDGDYLTDLNLNKYYPIVVASNSQLFADEIRDYEVIFYVYSEGFLDFGDMGNVIMISHESPVYEIVPEMVIDYFDNNRELFEKIFEIRNILGLNSVCDCVEPLLSDLDDFKSNDLNIEEIVLNVKQDMDEELKNSIKTVDIGGDEVLDLLNNDLPKKIEEIFEEIISKGKEKLLEATHIDFDPYIKKYPIEIDKEELERINQEQENIKTTNLYDKKITIASQLYNIQKQAEEEIEETIKFDYEFTLGSFAYTYNLNKPQISENLKIKQGINLNLALNQNIQKIDYHLSPEENIALLTGANSGGKTTLLETIGQINIMTQMGLPIPAEKAEVKILDEIYYFSKGRSLDAGAFESFLNVFMPIVTNNHKKLVLLDELEGITELEAAVKIISSFIEMLKETESYGIIVTHMAKELSNYTKVRIDGIEAKGLDKNYNLIVNRTPQINLLAKSTPELILKRIYENSNGKLKEVYGEILKKF